MVKILSVAAAVLVAGLAASERPFAQAPQRGGGAGQGTGAGTAQPPAGRGARGGGPPAPLVANPNRPFLRTSDGKPDMNGVFSSAGGGGRGEPISFQPWAAEKNKTFVARQLADNPTARCLSPGIVGLTTVNFFPIQFVQIPDQMVILYEWDHFFRVIPIDGRKQLPLEEIDTLQSLGHSVGKWEGDTLVVDVLGLSDYTWVGQAGVHSDQLHAVERFTMIDRDTIKWEAVFEDPKAWTKPWTTGTTLKRRPAEDALMEYSCMENNKADDHPPADQLVR